jgi:hypothetical protein
MLGIIVTIFYNTNNNTIDKSENKAIEQISVEKQTELLFEYVALKENVTQTEVVYDETVVSTQIKSTPVAKVGPFDYSSSNKLLRTEWRSLSEIIATKPRDMLAYFDALLDTEHIEDAVTKRVHHIGVALMKDRRIRYVDNFISEAHTDAIVWRYVKGVIYPGSSP